jgi:hypothetical protein
MVAHASNPSTQDAETGRSQVLDKSRLHSETLCFPLPHQEKEKRKCDVLQCPCFAVFILFLISR